MLALFWILDIFILQSCSTFALPLIPFVMFCVPRLLNGNQLTGPLPEELGNLPNLDRIQIDENKISGPLPKSFANLNKTKHLWVSLKLYYIKSVLQWLTLLLLLFSLNFIFFTLWAVTWTTIQSVVKSHLSYPDYQVLFTCKLVIFLYICFICQYNLWDQWPSSTLHLQPSW